MKKMYWRKAKTLAMLNNRRQWNREFLPAYSSEIEIQTEDGYNHIRTETSSTAAPEYIRTE
jgi:hypothetical protein